MRAIYQKVGSNTKRTSSRDGLDSDALLGASNCCHYLYEMFKAIIYTSHSTYPATLQYFTIGTKSQLGTGLAKLPKSTDGKVLLVQLFGCDERFCLYEQKVIIK